MVDKEIAALVAYAERTGLIEPCERAWAVNTLLEGRAWTVTPPPKSR